MRTYVEPKERQVSMLVRPALASSNQRTVEAAKTTETGYIGGLERENGKMTLEEKINPMKTNHNQR